MSRRGPYKKESELKSSRWFVYVDAKTDDLVRKAAAKERMSISKFVAKFLEEEFSGAEISTETETKKTVLLDDVGKGEDGRNKGRQEFTERRNDQTDTGGSKATGDDRRKSDRRTSETAFA